MSPVVQNNQFPTYSHLMCTISLLVGEMAVSNLRCNCKLIFRWPHGLTILLLCRVRLLVGMRGVEKLQASSIRHISMTRDMSATAELVFVFVTEGDVVS